MGGSIAKIGVVGAGQMGSGIAHVCALAGFDVLVSDLSADRINAGLAAIESNLSRQAGSGRISDAEKDAALARIAAAGNLAELGDTDLILETIAEDEAAKRSLYSVLCPVLRSEAIIATNSSTLSITRLGAATDRPARFLGLHFMNPVPLMELVEIIRGIATSDDTFTSAEEFVAAIGKTATTSR